MQAFSFSIFTVILYGIFLAIQTGRHRRFFVHSRLADAEAGATAGTHHAEESITFRFIAGHTSLLVLNMLPIVRSEEHTSELQSLMRISYAVFCLKKKNAE